jgi:butyrate kinase
MEEQGDSLNKFRILAINPGATSTKIAVFENEAMVFKTMVAHPVIDLDRFATVFEQYSYRLELVMQALVKEQVSLDTLAAVVGRGGLLKPLSGGTYAVNALMLEDMQKAQRGEHASNLGAVMANNIAVKLGIPAFIVDPVSVDEMEPVARISGLPNLERVSMSHALNVKAVAYTVAKQLGKRYEDVNFVVAHLGTGVSVTAHKQGRMIDVNNAREDGPFSPDRCGGLPTNQLVKLCYSGEYTLEELQTKLNSQGGIYAYLGTKDIREVEAMVAAGQQQAGLILEALSYQVGKEIGAMAAVLCGEVDRIVLTGGIAYSARVVGDITRMVQFIAPVVVIPGEEEMEALVFGALRVLRQEEQAKIYQ